MDNTNSSTMSFVSWIVYAAAIPTVILLLVWPITAALTDIKHPFVMNFGTGEAVLLAGLICLNSGVEAENYLHLSAKQIGNAIYTWKTAVFGIGVVFLVAFGFCKGMAIAIINDQNAIDRYEVSLSILSQCTLVALLIAIVLGILLKVLQIKDAAATTLRLE